MEEIVVMNTSSSSLSSSSSSSSSPRSSDDEGPQIMEMDEDDSDVQQMMLDALRRQRRQHEEEEEEDVDEEDGVEQMQMESDNDDDNDNVNRAIEAAMRARRERRQALLNEEEAVIQELDDEDEADGDEQEEDDEQQEQQQQPQRRREETAAARRRRRKREADAYFQDEYGDGNFDVYRLLHTEHLHFDEEGENARYIDEDDEPEEHAAGMVLPNVDLTDTDVYYRELFRVLCAMGTETTRLLTQLLVEQRPLTPPMRHRCNLWVKYWTSYLIEHHYQVLGRILTLPTGPNGDPEKLSGSMCIMGELWRLKLILNHHRLGQIADWKIADSPFLMKWLLETPGVLLDCPPKEPSMRKTKGGVITEQDKEEYAKAMDKYAVELNAFRALKPTHEVPILRLPQSRVQHLTQFLTGRIKVIPYHADIRMLIETIELKTAMFYCQTCPGTQLDNARFRTNMQKEIDRLREEMEQQQQGGGMFGQSLQGEFADAMRHAAEESIKFRQAMEAEQDSNTGRKSGARFTINRDYWIFCTCYFYPLTRALYYVDMFPLLQLQRADRVETYLPEGATERLEKWCRHLAKQQGDKYFERLEDAAADAMLHDGDMDWHLYRYPEESTNVAVILRKVRGEPHYEDYHEQTGLSATAVLDQVNRNWLSTTYVLALFDRYLKTYKSTNWRDGYVVENAYIDEPETLDKWTITHEPLLMNVFSNYWLLLDRKVLPINNIYTSICMWLLAIRKTRQKCGIPTDCLSDNTYIGDVIDTVIFGKGNISYSSEPQKDEEYTDKLRRGLPVEVTRLRI